MKKITVTKLEAAERHIRVAITLLFDGGDPVPVHTLTMAAFRILKDLAEQKGSITHQYITDHIKPGMEGDFWTQFGSFANFFKHADRDPDSTITIDETANDLLLMLCCKYYRDLTGTWTANMTSLVSWISLRYPHFLRDEHPLKNFFTEHGKKMEMFSRAEQLAIGKATLAAQKPTAT